jgi:hypothetical protein
MSKNDARSKSREMLWRVVSFVCLFNFVICIMTHLFIGGSAVNGFSGAGKYFVANGAEITQVTRAVFYYSLVHSYSLYITHPLAFIALYFADKEKKSYST